MLSLLLLLICLAGAHPVFGEIRFSESSLRMLINETTDVQLILSASNTGKYLVHIKSTAGKEFNKRNQEIGLHLPAEFLKCHYCTSQGYLRIPDGHDRTIQLEVEFSQVILVHPKFFTVYDDNMTKSIGIHALTAGESHITTVSSFPVVKEAFVTIQVYKSEFVEVLSIIMGWGYFLAWSISFYPQIYENYKRKSVVGLNFDFLAINLTGYFCYAAFNLGLYYIPQIKEEYSQRYPKSIISVFPNDIFFALHGIALTAITCLQCFWYERGDQKISNFGKGFHYVSAAVLVVSAILSGCNVIQWLDFLYICSYIKLMVTICKYAPQALMNYKRQNTEGWSIEAVLLDVAGGVMSILQMFLNAHNYEKWEWILENPTKLGLGILSLLFDFIFMAQHYCLYSEAKKIKKRRRQGSEDENRTDDKVINEKC